MPELRHLRTFVAVAEELSFTRAARRLFVAQQAVSKAVQQLEAELGVALLERSPRAVRLTPAGAELLERGRAVLVAADAAFTHVRALGAQPAGPVRLGASPAVGAGVVQAAVTALRASTTTTVSVHDVRPRDVRRALRDGELDLLLARTLPAAAEVARAELRPTPAVLAVPAGHRLDRIEPVPLRELHGERLLVASPPGTPYTDLLVARLGAARVSVEVVQRTVLGAAGLDEVATGAGVALVADGSVRGPGVVHVRLAEEVALPLLVAWPAGRPTPALARVREALGEA